MAQPEEQRDEPASWLPGVVMTGLALLAVAVRRPLLPVESLDFRVFLDPWWTFLDTHGHLAGLADDSFSNYNTPYLVLLALSTYLPWGPLLSIKLISIAFDLALAWVGSRLAVVLRPGRRWAPVVTFGALVFLPTVVMNSSVWGQCDAIYATFCLASVLALARGRAWTASAWFGVAFAFKLQAVFLLPVLVGVLLVNRLSKLSLLAAVGTFLACLVPALAAGRGLVSQLAVYPGQIGNPSGIGGSSGQAPPAAGPPTTLTYNAPTPYAWLQPSSALLYGGLALVVVVVLAFGVWLLLRRRPLGAEDIVLVAAAATLLVPELTPSMHDRYFYLAEVLTVVACLVTRWALVPAIGIQLASISTYCAFLLGERPVPLEVAAGVALASALSAAVILVVRLR